MATTIATPPATPEDKCRCGHERAWHDSCSRCWCPFFLDSRIPAPQLVLKEWRALGAERKAKEARA
jgi:hypothetical protein